jgi:hypothetical protein
MIEIKIATTILALLAIEIAERIGVPRFNIGFAVVLASLLGWLL